MFWSSALRRNDVATLKSVSRAALLLLVAAAVAICTPMAQAGPVILAGHDAVAYFTENKPVLGSKDYTAVHNGAIYRFANASNRDQFVQNPEKYAPVYGGYCAYGTALGKKFDVDGKAFKIEDGRLYVNKNLKVYDIWKKDIPSNIAKADQHWPRIEHLSPESL